MMNLAWFRSWVRIGFVAVLFSALLLSFLSFEVGAQPPTQTGASRPANQPPGTLTDAGILAGAEDYVENMTHRVLRQAEEGRIQPAIGRETELVQLQLALDEKARTALVVGDPKSGKTTLVHQYILQNPQNPVYRLKMDKFFELRSKEDQTRMLKSVILHLEQTARNTTTGQVILYVENTGYLAQGAFEQLRPVGALIEAIAGGRQLPMILEMDAQTHAQNFFNNKVIYERVTTVEIKSATYDAVITHLRRIKPDLRRQLGIHVSDASLTEAARLAIRYKANSPFDFAETLVRQAGQRVRAEQQDGTEAAKLKTQLSQVEAEMASIAEDLQIQRNAEQSRRLAELQAEATKLQQRLGELQTPVADTAREITTLEMQLAEVEQIRQAKEQGRGILNRPDTTFEKEMIVKLNERIRELKLVQLESVQAEKPPTMVGPKQIQLVAADILKIPVSALAVNIEEAVKNIDQIKTVIRNQDHIIDRAALALASYRENRRRQEALARLHGEEPKRKPIWVALLAGRTGTGKTEFAKQLAKTLGIAEKDMLRFDMNIYQSAHSVDRLIGAPPGYVGYEAGGELTEPVRERPFRVILFDEIEKAHPNVMRALMGLMDDARLTDGQGRTVMFDDCIMIFTTNAGERFTQMNRAELIQFFTEHAPGLVSRIENLPLHELRNEAVKAELRAMWSEAEVARFNDIMTTNNHTPEVVEQIVHDQIKAYARELRLIDGVRLVLSESAVEALKRAYSPTEGARRIVNTIKGQIRAPVDYLAVSRKFKSGDVVLVDFKDGRFDFVIADNKIYARAVSEGDKWRDDRLNQIRNRLAQRGQELTPETRPRYFRKFDPDIMVRNATARVIRRGRR